MRLAKGLSQKQLWISAGINEFGASTRINRYERGVYEANTKTIQLLSDVLEVPLTYFYNADNNLDEMILIFQGISPKGKLKILSLIKKTG
ncbi:MAG: helix-turn-helix domain-containing protein [Candidatus Malihini olakiniferum]